ncbi:hypothetical protein [Paenibacillus sp. GXUN7292]|uniref:hypothetical protein n=1 Tax=Paenibacillus sp. GXUN7292 TaxID=3422499 RepID=UPI003D7EE68A
MNNNLLRRTSKWKERAAELSKNKWIYLMFLPVLIWYAIFACWPMYGILIVSSKEWQEATGSALKTSCCCLMILIFLAFCEIRCC